MDERPLLSASLGAKGVEYAEGDLLGSKRVDRLVVEDLRTQLGEFGSLGVGELGDLVR